MQYQLILPFVEEFPTDIECSGILTSQAFLKEVMSEEKYSKISRDNLKGLEAELERIEESLWEHSNGERDIGLLRLLPMLASAYYIENFIPTRWINYVEEVKRGRKIYKLVALKRDGSVKEVMIKAPKMILHFKSSPPQDWLTSLVGVTLYKRSRDELETLLRLQEFGIQVEAPLGYFEQGVEQWLYTEFVKGKNPLEVLNDNKLRANVWRADARLLAKLCKARVKHQYFYSEKFDDKVWVDGELVLIDTDEAIDMLGSRHYLGKHPEELAEYQISWLKDCLSKYVSARIMREDEVMDYAVTFFREKGEDPNIAKDIVEKLDPSRMTEEDYNPIVMDSD